MSTVLYGFTTGSLCKWQYDPEAGPCFRRFYHGDRAPMGLDIFTGNRQSQATASYMSFLGGFALIEGLKDLLLLIFGYFRTGVRNFNDRLLIALVEQDPQGPLARRIFNGVGKQVIDQGVKLVPVTTNNDGLQGFGQVQLA